MRIHVTYTGGTIGMVPTPNGLAPGADIRGWIDGLVAQSRLDSSQVTLTELHPLIDSSAATPESWQAIIDDLWTNHDAADTFIVLHGTDTMAYTASALSYALCYFGKPIILTGAQLPVGIDDSDAEANMAGAFRAAVSGKASGVTLFFGHHLFAGNRVTKRSSWGFEAFDSPSAAPIARTGASWRWFPQSHDGLGWPNPAPYASHDVVVIDLVPGLTPTRLRAMLTPLPEAIIVRAYGVGNLPTAAEFTSIFVEALQAEVPVVVASQCQQALVVLGQYEAGDALGRAGAVGAADMTLEALYAKVVFLLSQGLRGRDVMEWIGKPIAGELTVKGR